MHDGIESATELTSDLAAESATAVEENATPETEIANEVTEAEIIGLEDLPEEVREAAQSVIDAITGKKARRVDWREVEPDFTPGLAGPGQHGQDESPHAPGLQPYVDAIERIATRLGLPLEKVTELQPGGVAAELNDKYSLEGAFDAVTPDNEVSLVAAELLLAIHGPAFGGDSQAALSMALLRSNRLLANLILALGPMTGILPQPLRAEINRQRNRVAAAYLTVLDSNWDELQAFKRDTPLSAQEDNDPTEEPGADDAEPSDPLTNG
jgi:hypothetical protein